LPHVTKPAYSEIEASRAFVGHARRLLLREYLPKIERCVELLSDEQVWWRANPEANSIGNLLLHLSGNARQWIVGGLGGAVDRRARPQEFAELTQLPRVELLARLRQTLTEVDEVLDKVDVHSLLERRSIQGSEVTVLEAIFHVTEHFSMHTGQIIFITKMLTASDLRFYDFQDDKPVTQLTSRSTDPKS